MTTGEDAFLRLLAARKPKLCVDVGANVGDYSRELLERTASTVIAFEPLPGAYAKLGELETRFPGRLIRVNAGVADQPGELPLYFGAEDSVLASFSHESSSRIAYVAERNTRSLMVPVDTLDAFFEHQRAYGEIDLLKIDVEGFEFEVLTGAQRTIERLRPKFVQLEYGEHQLFRNRTLFELAQLLPGYACYQLLPNGHGLSQRDSKAAASNIYQYSNFIFVRGDIQI